MQKENKKCTNRKPMIKEYKQKQLEKFDKEFPKDKVIVEWVGKLYGTSFVTEDTEEVEAVSRQEAKDFISKTIDEAYELGKTSVDVFMGIDEAVKDGDFTRIMSGLRYADGVVEVRKVEYLSPQRMGNEQGKKRSN